MSGRVPTSAEQRFAEKCRPVESGCVEWTGAINTNGYGSFRYQGRLWHAHRWAYVQANGPVMDSIEICHRCDVRRCVRLSHLFAGTHQENMADASAKGRISRASMNVGRANGNACLTREDVTEIRALREFGFELLPIAQLFSISKAHVCNLVKRKRWA